MYCSVENGKCAFVFSKAGTEYLIKKLLRKSQNGNMVFSDTKRCLPARVYDKRVQSILFNTWLINIRFRCDNENVLIQRCSQKLKTIPKNLNC